MSEDNDLFKFILIEEVKWIPADRTAKEDERKYKW